MKLRYQSSLLVLVFLSIFAATPVVAQPKTIKKNQSEKPSSKKTKRPRGNQDDNSTRKVSNIKLYRDNIVTFQASRLASIRFPAVTFSYERRLNEFLAATASVGLPINRQEPYRESNGQFSGIEVGLGFRAYTNYVQRKRMYFQLEGTIHRNSLSPVVFIAEPDRPTFRAQTIELIRKRQLGALSLGSQFVAYNGLTFDLRAGLSGGRRGIFTENGELYLSIVQENLFSTGGPAQNRWGNFLDLFLGFGLGYAF